MDAGPTQRLNPGAPNKNPGAIWPGFLHFNFTCFFRLTVASRSPPAGAASPLNRLFPKFICATCLLLMFFETAFGICLGCKIYNLFSRRQALLCPGGVCQTQTALPVSRAQMAVTVLFFVGMVFIGRALLNDARDAESLPTAAATPETAQPAGECTPPDWAVAMGHAEKWKLHHNCK